jgi:hypothetical protein
MGNPEKGEVSFQAGGETYTIVFSNNAWCVLEAHLDRGILDIYSEIESWAPKTDAKGKPIPETKEQEQARVKRIKLGFCRALFWAGLIDRHPDLTVKQAGEIMTSAGGLLPVMNLITTGILHSQPEASGTPRPTNRAARRASGVGSNS